MKSRFENIRNAEEERAMAKEEAVTKICRNKKTKRETQ